MQQRWPIQPNTNSTFFIVNAHKLALINKRHLELTKLRTLLYQPYNQYYKNYLNTMPLAAIGLDCSHCFSNTLVTLYLTKHTIIVNWFYSCFMELVCLQAHTCYYCFQLNDFCNHFNQLCSCMLYCSCLLHACCVASMPYASCMRTCM